MIQFKKTSFATAGLALMGMFVGISAAYAQTTTTSGLVVGYYAEGANNTVPGDYFTIQLSEAGRCGSKYFHINRSLSQYKEAVVLAASANATNRYVTAYVTGCSGNRNIITHLGGPWQ